MLEFVTAEVRGNVLRLKSSKSYSTDEPVRFKITVPNLEGLTVSGAGRIDIKGMKNEKFEIDSNGAPNIIVSGTLTPSTSTVTAPAGSKLRICAPRERWSTARVFRTSISTSASNSTSQSQVLPQSPIKATRS